jgi:hypothetical protein
MNHLHVVESGIKHHKTNKTNKQTESDFVNAVHTDVKSEVDMSSHLTIMEQGIKICQIILNQQK